MPTLSTKRTAAQRKGNRVKGAAKDAWLGPVERRDPVTYQRKSECLTWMCRNPFCRQWTMRGSYKYGRCNFCDEPRPTRS